MKAAKPANMATPISQCGMSIFAPCPPRHTASTVVHDFGDGRSTGPLRARATDTFKPPRAAAVQAATELISSKLSPNGEPNRLNGRINLKELFIGCSSGRE